MTDDAHRTRASPTLKRAKAAPRCVTFIMAGDPDHDDLARASLKALPEAGADVIELGMPFTDPMADGPAIQAAGLRALKAGQTMTKTLALVRDFREGDDATPIVLMGYYNPIYVYGVDALPRRRQGGRRRRADRRRSAAGGGRRALPAGAEGRAQLHPPRHADDRRQAPAGGARNTSGFVYYVSITGITGAAAPDARQGRGRGRAHQARTPSCRSRSASASSTRRAGARHRARRRRRRGRLGAGRARCAKPRSRRQGDAPAPSRRSPTWSARAGRKACASARRRSPPSNASPPPVQRGYHAVRSGLCRQTMNWISNVVRPKIRSFLAAARRRRISGSNARRPARSSSTRTSRPTSSSFPAPTITCAWAPRRG